MGVFVEAADEVGDGGVEVVVVDGGGVEEQIAGAVADGGGVGFGHAGEHFEGDLVGGSEVVAEEEGVGDVEEVVGGDAEVDGGGVTGAAGELQHAFEVGVGVELGGVGGERPAVEGGVDFFHGEVGAFDEADLDGGAAVGDAAACPGGEFLLQASGVWEVGLEDDTGVEVFEFWFCEGAGEGVEGEVEVAVFLHVEVDEFRGAVL